MSACITHHKFQGYHENAERGYSVAIKYYSQQKERFLKTIEQREKQLGLQQYSKDLLSYLNSSLQNPTYNDQSVKMSKVFQEFEKYIESWFNNKTSAQQISMRNLVQNKVLDSYAKKILPTSASATTLLERARSSLESNLASAQIQENFEKIFQSYFPKQSLGFDSAQVSNIYGFARRELFNLLSPWGFSKNFSSKSFSGYVNSFNGYFKEDILAALFDELLKKIHINANVSGSETYNGKQSEIDVILGDKKNFSSIQELNQKLIRSVVPWDQNKSFTIEKNINLFEDFGLVGLQSKSWPSLEYLNAHSKLRPFFSIGDRSEFYSIAALPGDSEVRGWHYNIYALSRNVIPLLGAANILYSTRDKVMWTCDLIQQFKQAQYYLSFYFKHSNGKFIRPATKEVTWQQEVLPDKFKGFTDFKS